MFPSFLIECEPSPERRSSWISSLSTRYIFNLVVSNPQISSQTRIGNPPHKQMMTVINTHGDGTHSIGNDRKLTWWLVTTTTGLADKGACRGEGGYPPGPATTDLRRKADVRHDCFFLLLYFSFSFFRLDCFVLRDEKLI
jgi:hypothetical protein